MKHLITLALLFASVRAAYAEPYSVRPDVLRLKVDSQKQAPVQAVPSEKWEAFKRGTLRFLAEMEALYPADDYYFLARDGEYLYDAMKVLAQGNPELLNRIRLVNVSRLNSQSQLLPAYLEQEGLSPERLNGRGAVLIDTCCKATIPDTIKRKLPDLANQLKSHFVTSTGQNTPSSRVFLEALTPGPIEKIDTTLGIELEDYPHFTNSSLVFDRKNGKLQPENVTPVKPTEKAAAHELMRDIKLHFSRPEVKQEYASLVSKMSAVAAHARGEQTLAPAALAQLLQELSEMGAVNFLADLEDAAAKGTAKLPYLDSVQTALKNPLSNGAAKPTKPSTSTVSSPQPVAHGPTAPPPLPFPAPEPQEVGLAADFLEQSARPTVPQMVGSKALVEKALEGVPLPEKLQDEKGLYKIYEEVLAEVLQKNPDHKLVFLARDSELLFDGLQALIENHPQKALLKDRVVLMNLSRPLAQSSNLAELKTYLGVHGISLDEMVNGNGKYLFFDTGNRGSIFLQLLEKTIEAIPNGAGRADKIKNLMTNMNVLLMGSERPNSTLASVLPQIDDQTPNWKISQLLRGQLFFDEALQGKAQKLGMPTDPLAKRRWIADRVEYLPHWTGRALYLKGEGTAIGAFEASPTPLQRKQALLLQARAIEHFQSPEVAQRFQALLTGFAAASPAPASASMAAVAQPKPSVPIYGDLPATKASNLTAMQALKPATIVETESGLRYRIVKEVDVGKRGKVYQAADQDGKLVAIKVPKNSDADTLASIKEETEKVAKLKEHGLPHAAIREASDTVVVKDWVEGVRADAFMKQWEQNGKNPNAPEIKKLAELLDNAASKKVYVGDLNPKNLIWTNGDWVIVDSGGIDEGKAKDVALKRYLEKIPRRWSKYVQNPDSCSAMFTHALQKQLSP